MPSKRAFYETVLAVTIISEEPVEWDDLNDVDYAITQGDCSGNVEEISHKILSGKQAAEALLKQGSDPGFFLLDENGNDLEE